MMPPSTTAAHTWRCVRLTGPSHASGDTHRAKTMPSEPLKSHQPGKQPIRPSVNLVLIMREKLVGRPRDRRVG